MSSQRCRCCGSTYGSIGPASSTEIGSLALAKKAASKTAKTAKKKKKRAASANREVRSKTTSETSKKAPKGTPRRKATETKTPKQPADGKSARNRRVANVPAVSPATAGPVVPSTATEKPLTAREVDQFRQMLLEKRAEILGDVSTLHDEALHKDRRDAAGDGSSMPIHMADLGTDNYELEFTLGLIEGERAILQEIDEALERIRQSTYGICQATGKPIGKARLKAKPWAKYCYEYTLAQEQGQTRGYGY